jgi:ATP-dependent helicase/nuclease subunit A
MNKPLTLSPQAEASDPKRSAWVSANAGSGKTTVLVWRVIRLLLEGVPPARILCLTYTKAAAAHMANEILAKLGEWVRLSDDALDRAIAEIDSRKPDPARRRKARRLFAAALETPGGLKVQTIHAFCDRVLHMFPAESGAPAGFEVLDEVGSHDLLERARLETILQASREPKSALGEAYQLCIDICGDETIREVLNEAVRERQALRQLNDGDAAAAISRTLGIERDATVASVEAEIFEGPHLPRGEWQTICDTLLALDGRAREAGERLLSAIGAAPKDMADHYLTIFFKADGDPREAKDFGNQSVRDRNAALFERLLSECQRAAALREKLRRVRERDRSLALIALAHAVIARYEAAKAARGALDFADLVTKTVALLEREESAWVHFRLDGGIDHILVDEAQDTSPEQWRIIGKLAEEFFAGKGASDKERTIFAVGDEKQSIFSFQGADPKSFDRMRKDFAMQIEATGGALARPELKRSYRSADIVLRAVDAVFKPERARSGLSAEENAAPVHEAVRANAPGLVEIWPLVEAGAEAAEDEAGWDAPLDTIRADAAQSVLADHIATAVRHWTGGHLSVGIKSFDGKEEARRPARPGDIIILVQQRGTLFEAILRALKQKGVPVAGADRLKLTEHIAVMDLIALGDALLLEADDLQLAAALKSPLIGFGDDDLIELAHGREGTLAQRLADKASENPRYREADTHLARWREEAAHLRPYDLYSRILGRDGGRKKMIARLGPEAADALDEFLSLALAYESAETPSLQGLLAFLRRTEAEIKRDLETQSDAVRVMTVHGVKGLEAPIVMLAETTVLPFSRHDPKVMPFPAHDGGEPPPAFVWAMGRKEDSQRLAEARSAAFEARAQEYRRLLYVALTRAADVLVICGMLNKNQREAPADSWYGLVRAALVEDAGEAGHVKKLRVPYFPEEISRWRAPSLPDVARKQEAPEADAALPVWLTAPFSGTSPTRKHFRPSLALAPNEVSRAPGEPGGRTRGVLIHRLLQSLAEVAPDERQEAAMRYLKQRAPRLTPLEHAALAGEALRVIDEPACAALFGPGSRAEAELIAHIDGPDGDAIEVSARLDRILIGADAVTFADFKSDAIVPASAAEIPAHYLAQLAVYRAALGATFPGRRLRGLLVFTAGPKVFEIPGESLESAWRQLAAQGSAAYP